MEEIATNKSVKIFHNTAMRVGDYVYGSSGAKLMAHNITECKEMMLDSIVMTGDEVRESWTNLVLTAPLNAPKCPKGCPATYSDCNQNYNMVIEEAA